MTTRNKHDPDGFKTMVAQLEYEVHAWLSPRKEPTHRVRFYHILGQCSHKKGVLTPHTAEDLRPMCSICLAIVSPYPMEMKDGNWRPGSQPVPAESAQAQ